MRYLAKYGPIALAGLAAAIPAMLPGLSTESPALAGVLNAAAILLASFAPQPHRGDWSRTRAGDQAGDAR